MQTDVINFDWNFNSNDWDSLRVGKDIAYFRLKKLMSEFVWDITYLEGNTYDFVEVQTLLEGITIGGHFLSEQKQVLNQYQSLKYLMDLVRQDNFCFGSKVILAAHNLIAEEEAQEWGCLRKGEVRISGTEHQPPRAEELYDLLEQGVVAIQNIAHPVERALVYFCFGSLNQFFYDGNKRTSRWTMNGLLMSHGYNYLSVPGRDKEIFSQLMIDFYNSKNATEVMKYLRSCYVID